MANLKVKKAQLSGPIQVGSGWLVTKAWAALVLEDRRFLNVETTDAAFAGLDVDVLPEGTAENLERLLQSLRSVRYDRTSVMIEGEDGTICRVYHHERPIDCRPPETPVFACLPEDTLAILGKPGRVFLSGDGFFHCGTGILTRTTDECPPWAMEVK